MLSRRHSLIAIPAFGLTGCNTNPDLGGFIGGLAPVALAAASLTDDQVRGYATQMVTAMDGKAKVATDNSRYARRLNTLAEKANEEKGLPLNYKVYLDDQINAFACADGSIRFYSALMDVMTDDEIRYVIGHEVGHVIAGHHKQRSQAALAANAARQAIASSGSSVAMLAQSQIGDLVTSVILAQYSQSNEREADDYAMVFLSARGYNRKAAVTALEKLEKLSASSSQSSWLSTHPLPRERADRIRLKLA